MRHSFLNLFGGGERLPPLENKMAKRWVKERLKRIFPELQGEPEALERAYNELGIESRPGAGKGGGVVYEIALPELNKSGFDR